MESRLGGDFSHVRVHTDDHADRAARSLGALAFTAGHDIVFRAGYYSPASPSGRHILAHELAHVLQQARAPHVRPAETGTRGDAWESAADAAAYGRPVLSKPAGAAPGLQRSESFEHADESDRVPGSRSASTSSGIPLTTGEINALADLYGTVDELYHASSAKLIQVLALLHRQQRDHKSVREWEWDAATDGRYSRLNLRNSPHFAASNPALVTTLPTTTSFGDNRTQFMRYYNETVVSAIQAYSFIGLPDPERTRMYLDRATIAAGFAEHFLMDAFSAGHLFNKDDFIAQARLHLDALPPDRLSTLLRAVAQRVEADPIAHTWLSRYEPAERPWKTAKLWRPNFDIQAAFEGLLEGLYQDPEGRQAVHNALVKVVHDRLTHHDAGTDAQGKRLRGVCVENNFSSWLLSGDGTLDTSPQTQAMIDRAIVQFRHEVAPYFAGPVPPGTASDGSALVAAHWPRPTSSSAIMIADQIRQVTDPASGMIDALVEFLRAELPSVLHALEARGEIRSSVAVGR